MWPDGWTAVTADGKRSAQFEHTLLVNANVLVRQAIDVQFRAAVLTYLYCACGCQVTETGCDVLTARLPSSPPVFPWVS